MKSLPIHRITLSLILLASLLFTSCKDDDTTDARIEQEKRYFDLYMGSTFEDTIADPTASGLYYIEVMEGEPEGKSPGLEDWVMVNFVEILLLDGTVVDTYMENVAKSNGLYSEVAMYGPLKFLNGSKTKGLAEGLTMMKEGGQAIMCMTSDLAYGSGGATLQREVGSYNSIRYEVELLEVIGEDIDAYEDAKIIAYTDTIPRVDTIIDDPTGAVMYYVVDEPTQGSQVNYDSTVAVAYKGYLTDGRVFDESAEGATYDFKVGDTEATNSPIIGWHRGLTKFKEGEKGRLIIPYPLAYGPAGLISEGLIAIPPYETLVFDIEVVEVRSESDAEEETK